MFLVAALALSGLPISGIFRSEFQIVAGGFARPQYVWRRAPDRARQPRLLRSDLARGADGALSRPPTRAVPVGETSWWMVAAMGALPGRRRRARPARPGAAHGAAAQRPIRPRERRPGERPAPTARRPRFETPFHLRPAPPTREEFVRVDASAASPVRPQRSPSDGARMRHRCSPTEADRARDRGHVRASRSGSPRWSLRRGRLASYPALTRDCRPRLGRARAARPRPASSLTAIPTCGRCSGSTRTRCVDRRRRRRVRAPVRPDPLRRLRGDPVRDRDRRRGHPGARGAPGLQAPRARGSASPASPRTHGVALAERVAGIASVAHALAYLPGRRARAARSTPPTRAQLWRVVHAELERIANHLDVAAALAEDDGALGRRRPLRHPQGGRPAAARRALRQPVRPRRGRPRRDRARSR